MTKILPYYLLGLVLTLVTGFVNTQTHLNFLIFFKRTDGLFTPIKHISMRS
jgi:hypothetical protein